jgi:hypothetical protein
LMPSRSRILMFPWMFTKTEYSWLIDMEHRDSDSFWMPYPFSEKKASLLRTFVNQFWNFPISRSQTAGHNLQTLAEYGHFPVWAQNL